MEHFFDYTNQVLIFAIFAVSLNLLLGYAGQLSIAHAAFGAVGGYTAAYVASAHGWTFLLALPLGLVVATAIGVLVSLPALFLDQEFVILLTLALATVVVGLVGAVPSLGGQTGLLLPLLEIGGHAFLSPGQFFVPLMVAFVLVLALCWQLGRSPFGRVLRAIRDDEGAARGLGKGTVQARVAVFGITAGMAGIGGVMLVYYDSSAVPGLFDIQVAMTMIAMVVIGGSGNFLGSIIGAAVVTLTEPFLEQVVVIDPAKAAPLRLAIYGAVIIGFVLLRPEGLIPEGTGWLSPVRALRRLAPSTQTHRPAAEEPARRSAPAALERLVSARHSSEPDGTAAAPALEVSGLRKRFGGITAADDLSLSLARGRVTGLVGPNGAGKTTVFNLLTGAIPAEAGRVVLRGEDISGWTPDRVARAGMGRTYQDVRLFSRMTVLENVTVAVPDQSGERLGVTMFQPWRLRRSERIAKSKALDCLSFVGLSDNANARAGELPFGDQKLVAIARLLAMDADVLLLDEPSSGIDMDGVDHMVDIIGQVTKLGKAVCVVEHNLHVLERVADWIYFMEAGRITAEGTLAELTSQERLAEVYFGSS